MEIDLVFVFSASFLAGLGIGLGLMIVNTIKPPRMKIEYDVVYDNIDKPNA